MGRKWEDSPNELWDRNINNTMSAGGSLGIDNSLLLLWCCCRETVSPVFYRLAPLTPR